MRISLRTRFQAFTGLICALGMAYLYAQILQLAGGSSFFSLDDPFIHLSLAENLLQGHYGINPGETASPSSSIAYPFLLVLTLAIGMGIYGALFWNVVGAIGAAWVLAGLLWDGFERENTVPPILWIMAPLLVQGLNGYALAFTGMEHTLHVWASLAIVAGLARVGRVSPPSAALIIAIIAAPLLRFEGFALSGMAVLALLYFGHWRGALVATVAIFGTLGIYVFTVTQLGLPPLPSSVMMKSEVSASTVDASFLSGLFAALAEVPNTTFHVRGYLVWGGFIAILAALALPANRGKRVFGIVVLVAILGHMIAGKWDWFSRYEIYLMAMTLGAALVVWHPILAQPAMASIKQLVVLSVATGMGLVYLPPLVRTPAAAQNIHDQQYQMHRFATEYFPETVAVNDLGWVSFRNDNYVLDLWGLGSETARQNWANHGLEAGWVHDMVSSHNATYAMLYPGLFETALDPSWCKMAELETIQVSSFEPTVGFYLTDPTRADDMRAALSEFAATVPGSAMLNLFDCP